MKRGWLLVLLVSLGLNLGLGVRLLRSGAEGTTATGRGTERRDGPGWERPAASDSVGWRRVMDRRLDRLARSLDLRPEQVERFRAAQDTLGRVMRIRRRELFAAREHVRDLMSTGQLDEAAVRRAMADVGARQAAVDSLAAEMLMRELAALDPAQRARYLDFLPPGGGGRGGHRGHRGQRAPR